MRARIAVVFLAAALVGICVATACADHHCSDANGCTLSDGDLQSCANIDTGIYGITTYCQSRIGCDPSEFGDCAQFDIIAASSGVIQGQLVDVDAGPSVESVHGRYALSLSPGDYEVCCSGGPTRSQQCAMAHVEAGKKVRVDAKLNVSIGGGSCMATAR